MVNADRHDERKQRVGNDIRGIKSAAKPDLQNQNIHLLFIKIMKRRTGCNFKKRRNRLAFCRQLFAELPHQGDFLCKIIIRNFRTIEEIAFIVSLQMGGGICADAIARLL